MTEERGRRIHPTAVVDPRAEIGDNVVIGPYCVVEGDVVIGEGTRLGPHVVVYSGTRLGRDNFVDVGAVLGMVPQDLKYKGERTTLVIGDGNHIGAYATVSRGTETGRGETRIGSRNYMMAMVHIGHDCIVGDETILTQGAALSGMVTVEDWAVLGGMAGVHQFVRIGRLAMVGGMCKVTRDVPPYMLVDGHPAQARGINTVGLTRRGVSEQRRSELRRLFRILFRSPMGLEERLAAIREQVPPSPERDHVLKFVAESERGICQ